MGNNVTQLDQDEVRGVEAWRNVLGVQLPANSITITPTTWESRGSPASGDPSSQEACFEVPFIGVGSGEVDGTAVVGVTQTPRAYKPKAIISLAVGSNNPVKREAAETGLLNALRRFPPLGGWQIELQCSAYDVCSEVSEQPVGDAETRRGACNRAKHAYDAFKADHGGRAANYSIGLEGGIYDDGSEMQCGAWMAVFDGTTWGCAKSAVFILPKKIAALVRGGMELGAADDLFFGAVNSKQKGGTVGKLTRGGITRAGYYVPAVELACVPLLWPDLYGMSGAGGGSPVHNIQRQRSPSVQALDVTALRIRLAHVTDLVYAATGNAVTSSINVRIWLDTSRSLHDSQQDKWALGGRDTPSVSLSPTKRTNGNVGVGTEAGAGQFFEFNQVLIRDLYSMASELCVQVYESSIASKGFSYHSPTNNGEEGLQDRDELLGELRVPLQELDRGSDIINSGGNRAFMTSMHDPYNTAISDDIRYVCGKATETVLDVTLWASATGERVRTGSVSLGLLLM